MALTVRHSLTMTTPDDPAYENQPQHWNQSHVLAGAYVEALSAGTRSDSGTVVFANSNGVTFGLDAGTMTASAAGVADGFNRIAAGTQTAGTNTTVVFANSNGITFGMSASSQVTASHNGLTSQSNQAVSGSNGSFTFQTVTFGSSNGLNFYTTNGSMVGSYTVPTQSAQTIGLYASSQTTGQSSSSTVDARSVSVVGAGIVSVGLSAGSFIVSATGGGAADGLNRIAAGTQTAGTLATVLFADSNGISFGMSDSTRVTASYTVPTQSAQTLGLYAVSNTTGESSSSTFDARTLSFHGAGIASVGYSGGSVVISVPAGGGAGYSAGLSTAGNTAGSTGVTGTRLVLVASNGISASQSTDANGGTVTFNGPVMSKFVNEALVTQGGAQAIASAWSFFPFYLPEHCSVSAAVFGCSYSVATTTNNSSAFADVTAKLVLYTRNGSTLSWFNSGSFTTTATYTSNATASVQGARRLIIPLATASLITPGEYWAALQVSTTNTATGTVTDTTALARSISMAVGIGYGTAIAAFGDFGATSANYSRQMSLGIGSRGSAGSMASCAFSDITISNTNASTAKLWMELRNYSVW